MTADKRVHAFGDDVLGELDGVGIAAAVRSGELSAAEVAEAAIARARRVEPELHAVQVALYDAPRYGDDESAALYGVPTYIKDNTDLRGLPTNHGSEAFTARPAKKDGAYARQYLSTGMTALGKS